MAAVPHRQIVPPPGEVIKECTDNGRPTGTNRIPNTPQGIGKQFMSYAKKNVKNLYMSVAGIFVLAAIGIWQFYQFVNFTNASGVADTQGGSVHLWWAITMAVFACIAGVLVFSVFLRHDTEDELHIT
jgi:membrane associated rhomboid family serine protease